jgi:hypothetical protein
LTLCQPARAVRPPRQFDALAPKGGHCTIGLLRLWTESTSLWLIRS